MCSTTKETYNEHHHLAPINICLIFEVGYIITKGAYAEYNNNIIISNVYKHMSSVDSTQDGQYNLKQYDHYKILKYLMTWYISYYCIL